MSSMRGTLLAVLVWGGVAAGLAQDNQAPPPAHDTVYALPPVVVVGTQATERITPVTFSNLTARNIRERYSAQDIPVLLSELPSMTTYSENGNGIGYNYINLRGFDQRRLSVMINGVPQNDPEDHNVYWIDFPDLLASTDNVQVQRGAGSAFYGPPAIGGSVNLVTNPFSSTPAITFESVFGIQQYGDSLDPRPLATRKVGVTFNSGFVARKYLVYGRLGRITSDGYRSSSSVDLSSYFLGAMRIDESMTTRFHFFGGPIQDELAYYGIPKWMAQDPQLRRSNWSDLSSDSLNVSYSSRVRRVTLGTDTAFAIPRRTDEVEQFSQPHAELIHEWRISPTVTLHNTLFYYSGDGYFNYDASWADTAMLRIGTSYGFQATENPANTLVQAYVGNSQIGWLPRVEIDHGDGNLTLGAELRFHRSTHWGKIAYAENLPAGFDPDYHFYEYNGLRDIVSLYAQELYRLSEAWNIMGSVQCAYNVYGIRNEKYAGNTFSVPYFFVNPRAGINYNATETLSAYLSIAYTSREPRMRNLYAAEDSWFGATPQFAADTVGGTIHYDFTSPLARPEHLLDIEIGSRFSSADAALTVCFFWMDFRDELVRNGQVDIFGQPVTGNAGRTSHLGFEAEGVLALAEGLTLGGTMTVSRNTLVRYTVYDASGVPIALDGNPIAGFPDVLANLRLTYRNSWLTGSLVWKYVGPFPTDNSNDPELRNDAYRVWNAEILCRLPDLGPFDLGLRGEVRNILNDLYCTSGEGALFFPASERNYILGFTITL
jgi:iron complex outermembrane recepter protein